MLGKKYSWKFNKCKIYLQYTKLRCSPGTKLPKYVQKYPTRALLGRPYSANSRVQLHLFLQHKNNSSNNTASTSLNTMSSIWREFFRKNRFYPPSLGNLICLPALISYCFIFYNFIPKSQIDVSWSSHNNQNNPTLHWWLHKWNQRCPLILLPYKDLKSIFKIETPSKANHFGNFPVSFKSSQGVIWSRFLKVFKWKYLFQDQ